MKKKSYNNNLIITKTCPVNHPQLYKLVNMHIKLFSILNLETGNYKIIIYVFNELLLIIC